MSKTLKRIRQGKKRLPNQNITTGQHVPSYRCDEFLWLESQPLDALVQTIAGDIAAKFPRRGRDARTEEKLLFSLKVLLLNLAKLQRFAGKGQRKYQTWCLDKLKIGRHMHSHVTPWLTTSAAKSYIIAVIVLFGKWSG